MKILNINALRGPNYWSINRPQLIVMELDLEELETRPTHVIDGFYERIKNTLPGLYEHHCSEGGPGGFFERIKRGTWMGHVIEHIALEIQLMAGLEVGFGRTRGTGTEGHYHVVFDYVEEESGRLAAEKAVNIAQDLIDDNSIDIDAEVTEIRELYQRHREGPSTASILREAEQRNIPHIKLQQSSTYQLGYGCRQKKIAATITSSTSSMAVDLADDKYLCRQRLKEMRIPVAEGDEVFSPEGIEDMIEKIGFPLVVKPVSGNQGRGVTTNINSREAALEAFDAASEISESVIVERHKTGHDFRLLTINHKLVAAAKRTPAHVKGDGASTIKELIDAVNSDPQRGEGHDSVLTKIKIGDSANAILEEKGYTISSVLAEGEVLHLHHAANLSKGGTAEDVTDTLHPDVLRMAERISKIIGLDICGIDIMASTLDQPLEETDGVVLEVNAAPGFRMHLSPSKGKAREVAAPVLDMLFPKETESRIPIIAITGTNGKTTTTRLIAHIIKTAGKTAGYTSTDGIFVGDKLMMTGDCGGPKSAKFVLKDPTVEAAVLECARGGILREGLGFDHCDTAVVTNIASDHLGLRGINSLEKMARVKSVVPESVHPDGYAVLNADDDRVYAMQKKLSCKTILFSMNPNNLHLLAHREAGGICCVYKEEHVVIWDDDKTHMVENVNNIPLSFEGRAGFMIENILGAVAAAWSRDISIHVIRAALKSFVPSADQTPGRMNRFSFADFDVMVDYAHNPAGLTALKDFLSTTSYGHITGIVAAIGDRRTEDSLEMGRIAAEIFDHVIIREDADLRGKEPGETTEIIRQGIKQSGRSPKVTAIASEKEAFLFALNNALPGSLVMLCTEQIDDMLTLIKEKHEQHNARKLPLPKQKVKKSSPSKNQ